jgi:hypothetical protein
MAKKCLARVVVSAGLILGTALIALAPQQAAARVRVGIGIGLPLFGPAYAAPVYYPPAYYPPYAYAPAYYAPPAPAYYAQPQSYVQPQSYAPAGASASRQCREYNTTTVIDGAPQQTVGTACLQPDGTWRIVN